MAAGGDLDEWKTLVAEADLRGVGVAAVRALTYEGRPPTDSLSTPLLYVCSDSEAYCVKHKTQHPQLVAGELIAARALAEVGAGPQIAAVDVDAGVLEGVELPQGDQLEARTGVGLGSRSIENAFNTKEIGNKPADFDITLIDPASVGTAIAGLTWLAIGDEQAMIDCVGGQVFVHDAGDAFAGLAPAQPSRMQRPHSATIPADVGCSAASIKPALERIEALTDQEIADLVAAMPAGMAAIALDVRASMGQWMAISRDRLRSVLEAEWK